MDVDESELALRSEGAFQQHSQVCQAFPRQKEWSQKSSLRHKRLGELNCTCLAKPFVTDYHSSSFHSYDILNQL